MGLRAEFTMDDLGYAEATEELGIYIDYSYGCEVFAETFLQVAREMVPVRTGYLRSTIQANAGDEGCTCETDCDYAQYVEYGTCYMGAQPYFEPALAAALDAAMPYWDDAVEIALEEEEELLEEMEESERTRGNNFSRSLQGGGFRLTLGSFLGMVIAAVIVGLIQGFLNLLSDSGRSSGRSGGHSRSSSGGDFLKGMVDQIEVEIT